MEISEIVDDIKTNISDTISEKPHIVAVAAGILLLFVAALGILAWQTSGRKKTPKPADSFKADAPVLPPDAPNVENSYYQYRKTQKKWTEGEVLEFFASPDESTMESLEKANEKIADEITEAVP